jgi:voltage-gated potassium channel
MTHDTFRHQTVLRWFRRSPYAAPTVFFILIFVLTGVLIWVFELPYNDQFSSVMDGLWWSVITFSTTGYGDKVPVTFIGRLVAVLTIMVGIGGTSLLSGALASWLVDRNTKARRGLMDYKKLKDHLVICGWKNDMKEILLDILTLTTDIDSDHLLIVSNVDSERVEELKEDARLAGLKFVRGDYYAETSLRRASVETARKILILADTLESNATSEVDSKTVMTVLTIKAISREIYVTAEVLDKKYESYLKQAMCDEILFSRDFSRQMLANTSATNGMSHIIYDLLTQSGGTSRLTTEPVSGRGDIQTYGELKARFTDPDRVLLGVLENTGSPNRMKREALRDAQKTSDVSQLITNLQKVKGLEVNKPRFLPPDDHPIQRYTQAIVLERL